MEKEIARQSNAVEKGFNKHEGPFVQGLDTALKSFKVKRQQNFGGVFVGNHIHKVLKWHMRSAQLLLTQYRQQLRSSQLYSPSIYDQLFIDELKVTELAPDGFDAVSVQNVGSTYIIVSWDLPTDSNGILINFSLYCNGALAGVLPLTVISYNTTGLLPFTLYMYMSSSHARRHCTSVGTWCWASSVLQSACPDPPVHCDSNLLSMRTALLGDPLILSWTLMTLSSAYLLIRSLTLTSPLAPPYSICLDLIRSYFSTLPQDPMCILLQLFSLLVEHTAPNIHDSNKSVEIQMCSVLALI
eukprot:Em0022g591a